MGNILAFTSSGRADSISSRLVQIAADHAARSGHAVHIIDLTAPQLHCCTGCGYCRTADGCTIDDTLFQDITNCDGIIVGLPIYFSGIAGQAKVWLDRLYAMIDARFVPRHPGKKVLAIYTQGDGNEKAFNPAINAANYVFRLCGWKQIGSILCAGTSAPEFEVPEAVIAQVAAAAEKF